MAAMAATTGTLLERVVPAPLPLPLIALVAHPHGVASNESDVPESRVRYRGLKGSRHKAAKLNDDDVLEIRQRHEQGEFQSHLAKEKRVSTSTINRIVRNRGWHTVGGPTHRWLPGEARRCATGERVGTAKLKAHQVREIRRLFEEEHMKQAELAELFGVTPPTIRSIVKYQAWRTV